MNMQSFVDALVPNAFYNLTAIHKAAESTASKQKNLYVANDLVRLIVREAAAEVRVAPSEGFIPGRRNQHLVLLNSQNALVSAHDLTHWLF